MYLDAHFRNPVLLRASTLIFVALLLVQDAASVYAASPATHATNFTLTNDGGNAVSLSQFSGKIVFLDFWASWCPTCRHSMNFMNELQEAYGSKGLQVISVNVDTDRSEAEKFLRSFQSKFLVLFDPKGEVAEEYDLQAMPSSFLIGRDGKILEVHQGLEESNREALRQAIERLVSEKSV